MFLRFLRIVRALAKYGNRGVRWAWANKGLIYRWLSADYTVEVIIQFIVWYLGL